MTREGSPSEELENIYRQSEKVGGEEKRTQVEYLIGAYNELLNLTDSVGLGNIYEKVHRSLQVLEKDPKGQEIINRHAEVLDDFHKLFLQVEEGGAQVSSEQLLNINTRMKGLVQEMRNLLNEPEKE